MNINGRTIDSKLPPYICAEISCNHNGSMAKAMRLIDAAVMAGADAIKLQTYKPSDLTTRENKQAWDLYSRAMTPREWHVPLFKYADHRGVTAFSSPFSVDAVEFLERECDPPCYKIASPEALRDDIIEAVSHTKKPVIISTGALNLLDIDTLAFALGEVCFLHCIAKYPANLAESNISAITTLRRHARLVGLSDHTPGYAAPIAATVLGAVMIEKHIKLDDDCIDAEWSLDPDAFSVMVRMVRATWQGMGSGEIVPSCGPRAQNIKTWFENERLRNSA